MPRIGVSITKSTSFRGATQEFSNVYFYEVLSQPSAAEADTIMDNLTTKEKTFHATAVTFVKGRLWLETGNPATSLMISQKNLSGTGGRVESTSMDKERAFLFRLAAGVDSRGNPVYLRKWYHSCGQFTTAVTMSSAIMQNTASFSGAERDAMETAMEGIGDANGSPLTPKLCSKVGRLPNAGALWLAHAYLEHHQLGDQWRAS